MSSRSHHLRWIGLFKRILLLRTGARAESVDHQKIIVVRIRKAPPALCAAAPLRLLPTVSPSLGLEAPLIPPIRISPSRAALKLIPPHRSCSVGSGGGAYVLLEQQVIRDLRSKRQVEVCFLRGLGGDVEPRQEQQGRSARDLDLSDHLRERKWTTFFHLFYFGILWLGGTKVPVPVACSVRELERNRWDLLVILLYFSGMMSEGQCFCPCSNLHLIVSSLTGKELLFYFSCVLVGACLILTLVIVSYLDFSGRQYLILLCLLLRVKASTSVGDIYNKMRMHVSAYAWILYGRPQYALERMKMCYNNPTIHANHAFFYSSIWVC
eukprot:g30069.t1